MISFIEMHGFYYAWLWIHDILVLIWIRGSRPLTCGSGSCFFCNWLTSANKKLVFFQSFFAYTSVFKDKKSKRSHKIVISRFFFFCMLMVSILWYVDFYELFVLWVGSGVWLPPRPQPPEPVFLNVYGAQESIPRN
jgi:hypothetical protein